MNEKRFRFDLLVALLALLISAVAAGASAYQTYVIRKQFSATVWPYLTFITSSSTDKFFELSVSNPGIGPALIFNAVVMRDGRVIERAPNPTAQPALSAAVGPEQAAAREDELKSGTHATTSTTISTITSGDVLSPGQRMQLLRVDGKFLTRRILRDIRHIDLTLCYCSLLGDCWTKRLWDPVVKPRPVRSCPSG